MGSTLTQRDIYAIDDVLDVYIADPLDRGYSADVVDSVRRSRRALIAHMVERPMWSHWTPGFLLGIAVGGIASQIIDALK